MSSFDPLPTTFSCEHASVLLMEHYGFVYRQARRFIALPDFAEDVVQQVFVEMLKTPDRWRHEVDLRPLLTVITRRTAQKIWREQAKILPDNLRQIADLIKSEFEENLTEIDSGEERIDALQQCMEKMSEPAQQLLMHYYYDGMTTESIARQMQKKSNTVYKAIFRLREKLRDCIEHATSKEGSRVS